MHKLLNRRKSLTLRQPAMLAPPAESKLSNSSGAGREDRGRHCIQSCSLEIRRSAIRFDTATPQPNNVTCYRRSSTTPDRRCWWTIWSAGCKCSRRSWGEFALVRGSELGAGRGRLDRVAPVRWNSSEAGRRFWSPIMFPETSRMAEFAGATRCKSIKMEFSPLKFGIAGGGGSPGLVPGPAIVGLSVLVCWNFSRAG